MKRNEVLASLAPRCWQGAAAVGLLSTLMAIPAAACIDPAQAEAAAPTASALPVRAESVIEQIAALEVEKTLQSVIFTPDSPALANLTLRQTELREQLQALEPGAEREAQIAIATQTALAAKLEEVETQYRQDRVRLTDDHPIQQRRLAQIEALRLALL